MVAVKNLDFIKNFNEDTWKYECDRGKYDEALTDKICEIFSRNQIKTFLFFLFSLPVAPISWTICYLTVRHYASKQIESKAKEQWAKKTFSQNFKLATEVMQYVSKKIKYCNTRGANTYEEVEELYQKVEACRKIWKYFISQLTEVDFLLIHQQVAEISKAMETGNCLEMSVVGFFYLLEKISKIRFGFYTIKNGDHMFLALGLGPNSLANNYKSWGSGAFLCDFWSGKILHAGQIECELFDFVGIDQKTCKSIIKKFDSKKQSIELVFSNVYSKEEFKEISNTDGLGLTDDLDKFNKSKKVDFKIEICKNLLIKIKNLQKDLSIEGRVLHALINLEAQLKFFLNPVLKH